MRKATSAATNQFCNDPDCDLFMHFMINARSQKPLRTTKFTMHFFGFVMVVKLSVRRDPEFYFVDVARKACSKISLFEYQGPVKGVFADESYLP
jgi:hypothetical protein